MRARRSPSLFSRGVAAVVITILLFHPEHTVTLRTGARFRPDFFADPPHFADRRAKRAETACSQLGRILVVSIIALFGTTQIAANAVANNLDAVAVIPGQAMSLAMITVIGQCIGAGDTAQARYMAKKMLKITYLINGRLLPADDRGHTAGAPDLQPVPRGALAWHGADLHP